MISVSPRHGRKARSAKINRRPGESPPVQIGATCTDRKLRVRGAYRPTVSDHSCAVATLPGGTPRPRLSIRRISFGRDRKPSCRGQHGRCCHLQLRYQYFSHSKLRVYKEAPRGRRQQFRHWTSWSRDSFAMTGSDFAGIKTSLEGCLILRG